MKKNNHSALEPANQTWTIFDALAVWIATGPDRPRQSLKDRIVAMIKDGSSWDVLKVRIAAR